MSGFRGNTESEQWKKAFDNGRMKHGAEDATKTYHDTGRKLKKLESKGIPVILEGLWNDIKTLYGMLSDSIRGVYKVPARTLGAVIFTLIYFVSPIDFVPDFIPVLGYVDDAFIIKICLDFIARDLEEYRQWKETI